MLLAGLAVVVAAPICPKTLSKDLTPNPHFTVSCARSIPLEPKACEEFCGHELTCEWQFLPWPCGRAKATQKFQVTFCPTELLGRQISRSCMMRRPVLGSRRPYLDRRRSGSHSTFLKLHTLHNSFEDTVQPEFNV